ncbi:MAG: hypothetical protein E6J34_16275 [Chloroflexi bacterium]|nr:MAG: hypothetical protein E6J34_16275 [Chloroflexota bacterium]
MSNDQQFSDSSNASGDDEKLALWLKQVMQVPPHSESNPAFAVESSARERETHLELLQGSGYHVSFYQQLPDFVMALLTNHEMATVHYAPLLYHLAGCQECHQGYLELYDAMRAAVYPQEPRPLLGQGTRTLTATPQRMLGHLCQTLISQAEALWRDARNTQKDVHSYARSLLQLALKISARIVQSSVRRHATHDLVRVATLFERADDTPEEDSSALYSFTPALAGTGGMRGKKVVRSAGTLKRPFKAEQPVIHLHAHAVEGTIVQRDQLLELRLHNLAPTLRNRYVQISVPLGSLLEPVRWIGGNPRAIRSTVPVDEAGQLVVPLGQTELRLHDAEERSLLEAMFMLLEVRTVE